MYIVESINWLFEGMFSTKGSHILLLLHYISDIDSIRSVDIFICKRLRSTAKPAARHPNKAIEGLGTI